MSTTSSPTDLEPTREDLAQDTEQDHAPLCPPPLKELEDRELFGTPPPSPSPSPSPKVNGSVRLHLPAGTPVAAAQTVSPKEDSTMPQPQGSQFDPAAAADKALKSVSLELEEASKPKQSRAATKRETAPKRVSKRAAKGVAKPQKRRSPNQVMKDLDKARIAALWPTWEAKWAADAAAKAAPMPGNGVPGQPYGQNPLPAAPGQGIYLQAPGHYQAAGPPYQQPRFAPPAPPFAPPPASHLAPPLASHLAPPPAPSPGFTPGFDPPAPPMAFPPAPPMAFPPAPPAAFPPAPPAAFPPAPAFTLATAPPLAHPPAPSQAFAPVFAPHTPALESPTPSPPLRPSPTLRPPPQAPNEFIGLEMYNGPGQNHSAAAPQPCLTQQQPGSPDESVEPDEIDEFLAELEEFLKS